MPGSKSRNWRARLAPVQPQVVAGKTHQHRTHAEIQPARGAQGTHAGIDHRVAGAPFAPGGKAGLIKVAFAQTIAHACEVAKLDLRLALKFLHEVAMPTQSPRKASQVARQGGIRRRRDGTLHRLMHGAQRDRAKGQVRAQSAAPRFGAQGAGDRPPVAPPTFLQEAAQGLTRGSLARRLQRLAVWRESEAREGGQGLHVGAHRRSEVSRQTRQGRVHSRLPARRPARPVSQAADHARLRKFLPGHACITTPIGHRQVARIGPA